MLGSKGGLMVDDSKRFIPNYILLWSILLILVCLLVNKGVINLMQVGNKNAYYDSVRHQLNRENIIGSYIEDYNYSTKELTVKSADGTDEIYKVDNAPFVIDNNDIIDEELLSKLYTYLFKNLYYGRVKIIDWNESEGLLVFESKDKVVILKLVNDVFYKVR